MKGPFETDDGDKGEAAQATEEAIAAAEASGKDYIVKDDVVYILDND